VTAPVSGGAAGKPVGRAASGGIRIRTARPEDAAGIADAAGESWRATYLGVYGPVGIATFLKQNYAPALLADQIAAAQAEPSALFLVAAGAKEGVVGFLHATRLKQGPVRLWRLYLRPAFQRRGIGRALMDRLDAHLARIGAGTCVLTVHGGNDRAIAFYAKRGFRAVGETGTGNDREVRMERGTAAKG
jgi:ribosomal protein S18 acetylase RimI-like enzyme